ncbi:hypothetical protein IWX87_000986 [Polaromonas sp. CG_9.7]|nr:hypothetical protein [Polaromonas sp. CG_9.7]MBG6113239.1 hypothetical protein [Polaromonas sp. CG_9.2]MDH6185771.1 hypothetical protein [Polaromonas sp. CG_23.6]
MHEPKVAKALEQIVLRDAGAAAVQHSLNEQPIVPGSQTYGFLASWQQILDAFPLIISMCISFGHACQNRASNRLFKSIGFTGN